MTKVTRISSLSGLLLIALGWSGAAQATCTPLPAEQPMRTLLSKSQGGALLLDPGTGDPDRPSSWTAARRLGERCYLMPKAWREQKLQLAVNNHLRGEDANRDDGFRFDVGIQIVKISRRPDGEDREEQITAYRSKSEWYRNGRVAKNYYFYKVKRLDLRLSEWNDAHDPGNVINQNDRRLGGPFHASPNPAGRNTFDERRWWRLNEDLLKDYVILLENRLLSTQPAAGQTASGVPFQLELHDYDAVIIRYASANVGIDGVVTLCFSACDRIEKLKLEGVDRDVLAWLFSRRR